jgi:hypothetical protein
MIFSSNLCFKTFEMRTHFIYAAKSKQVTQKGQINTNLILFFVLMLIVDLIYNIGDSRGVDNLKSKRSRFSTVATHSSKFFSAFSILQTKIWGNSKMG